MRFFLMMLLFIAILPPGLAAAQAQSEESEEKEKPPIINPYDKKYRNAPIAPPGDEEKEIINILPEGQFSINFVREDYLEPGEAILRIAAPAPIDGCVVLNDMEIKREEDPPVLRVTIEKLDLRLDKKVKYDQVPCPTARNYVYVDIRLSREELLEKNITKLALNGVYGADVYDIQINNNKMKLTSENPVSFRPGTLGGRKDKLEYWFYPENTVMLTAPMARDPEQAYDKIKTIAASNNLVSLSSAMPDHQPDFKSGKARFFFVDETGALLKKMGESASLPMGEITLTKTYTGMQGSYNATENINVFAQKPGYYD